jgi:hypothetical protein
MALGWRAVSWRSSSKLPPGDGPKPRWLLFDLQRLTQLARFGTAAPPGRDGVGAADDRRHRASASGSRQPSANGERRRRRFRCGRRRAPAAGSAVNVAGSEESRNGPRANVMTCGPARACRGRSSARVECRRGSSRPQLHPPVNSRPCSSPAAARTIAAIVAWLGARLRPSFPGRVVRYLPIAQEPAQGSRREIARHEAGQHEQPVWTIAAAERGASRIGSAGT